MTKAPYLNVTPNDWNALNTKLVHLYGCTKNIDPATGNLPLSAVVVGTFQLAVLDDEFTISDDIDTSRKMRFELSGITSGTTRVVTMPDASGTLTLLGNASTGSGSVVLAVSPVFTSPTLGAATATTVNKVTITQPATGATLTIANGKTVTLNATITFAGTDGTTMTFPTTSASIARTDVGQTFTGNQIITGTLENATFHQIDGPNGSYGIIAEASQNVTLSTSAATTASSALIPPNSIVLFVSWYVTTTISGGGVTVFNIGSSLTAARFQSNTSALAAGSSGVGLNAMQGGVATNALGPVSTGLDSLLITCDHVPTQGAIRCVVFYIQGAPPTS